MKRTKLIHLLQRYNPLSIAEKEAKQKIMTFVMQYENCFERSCLAGHVTASAWLINKEGTHVLLMHHAKLDTWLQLGGHCDGDGDVLAVAIKEAQEESGISSIVPINTEIFDIDVHAIPEYKGIPAHYHYDIRFLLQVASDEKIAHNNESKELRWISKDFDQLPTQSESIVRMFKKWMLCDSIITRSTQQHINVI